MTWDLVLLTPLVFLAAGVVKGALGVGLPATTIAALSFVVDPRMAVALGLMSAIASNIWQLYREGRWREPLKRFWRLSVAGAVCLFAVSPMTASAPAELILIATGVTVAIFSTINLVGTQMVLAPRWEGPGQLTAGALAGVMGGLTGVAAPPVLAFLLALKLDKEEFVRSIGLLLLLGAIPLFFGYLEAGLLTVDVFLWSVVLCLPTIIGFSLGERLRRRMDTERFQKYVLIYFLIAGANMVRQAVSA